MGLDDWSLDHLFREARSFSAWRPDPVTDDDLRRVWDLAKLGPTSANCSPVRVVFLRSAEAKEKLRPALSAGNVAKTMAAPVTAIVGHDVEFHDLLPRLFPEADARRWFAGNHDLLETTAFRNGTLQGAYLILACRAAGLDCGPMSGFDNALVDELFFKGTTIRSNFLVNIGRGDGTHLPPRRPRLGFEEACKVI
ncbi:malonic semialdehyde reductase [Elioraea sp.]|uniref:malonic semialdehyde reductase n=1 Tax=Elioraea sp. TaxID=2185103 RepID=UPI003F6F896C